MGDEASLRTVERPICAAIAHETRLPECYDDWILPECYDHWDLPEVYIPVANPIEPGQRPSRRDRANKVQAPAALGEKQSPPPRSCWRRHWAWWILAVVLVVGGAAGGAIAGALTLTRRQGLDGSVVSASPTPIETLSGTTSLFGLTQPHGATSGAASQNTQGTTTTTTTTAGIQAPTVPTDSRSTSTSTGSGFLPSKPQIQETTTSATAPQKDSETGTLVATHTQRSISLPAPGTTVEGSPATPIKSPSPSSNSPEPAPLMGQPSKPTRAVQIGRASRPGEARDLLEIAFYPESPCDYEVIGNYGTWVCDTPFALGGTEYQWKGCGSYTWLVWGPTQERFGACADKVTAKTLCGGLLVIGVWLCSPE